MVAYHLVHTIHFERKRRGIHLGWEGLRGELEGQDRITVELKLGRTLYVRKVTRPETRQHVIYALGTVDRPVKTKKTTYNNRVVRSRLVYSIINE